MAALATDNFNRADANPIGAPWTTITGEGAMQIVSSAATAASITVDSGAYNTSVAWPNDQYSQANITVNATTSGSGFGVSARVATGAETYYRLVVDHAASGNVELVRCNAGSFTTLWTRTATFNDGDLLRLEAQGTTLRAFIAGVQVGADHVDGSPITTGSAGISFSSGSVSSGSLDNWEGGDFATAGTATPLDQPALDLIQQLLYSQTLPANPPDITIPWSPVRRPRRPTGRSRQPTATKTPAAQDTPPATTRRRRLPGWPPRPRPATTPVPPQVVVAAPTWIPTAQRIRLRGVRLTHGKGTTVVPPQVTVTPPAWVPPSWRSRIRVVGRLRTRPTAPVPRQDQPPATQHPKLTARPTARRPKPTIVPPQQAQPPSAAPRRKPAMLGPRRRTSRQFIPPQILLAPPYPPQPSIRRRIRAWKRRKTVDGWLVASVVITLDRTWSASYTRPHWLTQRTPPTWAADPGTTAYRTQPATTHWAATDLQIDWEA